MGIGTSQTVRREILEIGTSQIVRREVLETGIREAVPVMAALHVRRERTETAETDLTAAAEGPEMTGTENLRLR